MVRGAVGVSDRAACGRLRVVGAVSLVVVVLMGLGGCGASDQPLPVVGVGTADAGRTLVVAWNTGGTTGCAGLPPRVVTDESSTAVLVSVTVRSTSNDCAALAQGGVSRVRLAAPLGSRTVKVAGQVLPVFDGDTLLTPTWLPKNVGKASGGPGGGGWTTFWNPVGANSCKGPDPASGLSVSQGGRVRTPRPKDVVTQVLIGGVRARTWTSDFSGQALVVLPALAGSPGPTTVAVDIACSATSPARAARAQAVAIRVARSLRLATAEAPTT